MKRISLVLAAVLVGIAVAQAAAATPRRAPDSPAACNSGPCRAGGATHLRTQGLSPADRRMARDFARYLHRNARGLSWYSSLVRIAVRNEVISAYTTLRRASKRTAFEFCSVVQGSDVADFTPGHALRTLNRSVLVRCPARDD